MESGLDGVPRPLRQIRPSDSRAIALPFRLDGHQDLPLGRGCRQFAFWSAAAGSLIGSREATTSSGTPITLIGVVVPMHNRDLAKGTLNQIVSASGLDRAEFLKLL